MSNRDHLEGLAALRENFKKFKEKKWGMQNFFKMENHQYEEFKNNIELFLQSYIAVCLDPTKVQEFKDIVEKLKMAAEQVRRKEVISNGTGLKLVLREFDDRIRELIPPIKSKRLSG